MSFRLQATEWFICCLQISFANVWHYIQPLILKHLYICIPRTKYVRGILWFSRRYAASAAAASAAAASAAAASAAAASADISSFSW